MNYKLFGQLFDRYRLKSGFATLSDFGKALADEGFCFEDSTFSRWKNGSRIPKHPEVLSAIIRIFTVHNGIESSTQIQQLYLAAGQPPPQHYLEEQNTPSEFCLATYLCKHILGETFFKLHTRKLHKLYPLAEKDLRSFILTLQKIEHNPHQFTEHPFTESLIIRELVQQSFQIKKAFRVSKADIFVMGEKPSPIVNYLYVSKTRDRIPGPVSITNYLPYAQRHGLSTHQPPPGSTLTNHRRT